jgi:zinc protease
MNAWTNSYYATDLISDILSRGNSSRLHRNLIKDKQLFSDIGAYSSGSIDKAMFVVEGKPSENVSIEQAEAAIWEQLEQLKTDSHPG